MKYLVKVTRKGQVTIPKSMREALGIREGDLLEARLEEGRIVLSKPGIPEPGEPVGPEEYERIVGELERVRARWR
ncbi:MAG: AbrB family transcriptional regulator [Thermoprotei archaeon]|nr:MAG: AbrB family transcriptional regulator [Thermoprotei archaeon]